jgi:hypothetical protein
VSDRIRDGLKKIIDDCEAFGDEPNLADLRALLLPRRNPGDVVRVSEYVADLMWVYKITHEEAVSKVHGGIASGDLRLTSTFDLEFQ